MNAVLRQKHNSRLEATLSSYRFTLLFIDNVKHATEFLIECDLINEEIIRFFADNFLCTSNHSLSKAVERGLLQIHSTTV